MDLAQERKKPYTKGVYQALFLTSYTPLFLFIILRQITSNASRLCSQSFDYLDFLISFGFSIALIILIVYGLLGLYFFIKNVKIKNISGSDIKVVDIENKNSEVLSYISTYIIPFLFQSYSSLFEIISIILLLLIIYYVYKNSSLIQINPLLNFWYSIYEIEYKDVGDHDGSNNKRAMVLIKERNIEENDILKFNKLDNKLFFATLKDKTNE